MPFPSIYTNITIVLKNLDVCFFHRDNIIIQKSTHNGSYPGFFWGSCPKMSLYFISVQ